LLRDGFGLRGGGGLGRVQRVPERDRGVPRGRAFDQLVDPGPVSFELFGLVPQGGTPVPALGRRRGRGVRAGRRPESTAVQLGAVRGVDRTAAGGLGEAGDLVRAGGAERAVWVRRRLRSASDRLRPAFGGAVTQLHEAVPIGGRRRRGFLPPFMHPAFDATEQLGV